MIQLFCFKPFDAVSFQKEKVSVSPLAEELVLHMLLRGVLLRFEHVREHAHGLLAILAVHGSLELGVLRHLSLGLRRGFPPRFGERSGGRHGNCLAGIASVVRG
jgi:hypothetical protein